MFVRSGVDRALRHDACVRIGGTPKASSRSATSTATRRWPPIWAPIAKGVDLAVEEINAAGGVLGKKLEIVSRDDGANPGDAVRMADELRLKEQVDVLTGTILSHVGLAVADYARQHKMFFLASAPLTDKIVWESGNRYTFRLRPSTYTHAAVLVPHAAKLNRKRWAFVYPNYEYGQSAVATFKELLKKAQPDVEFVADLAPPLGRIDAGSVVQALANAKPDAIFNVLFGADLAKFAREGKTREFVQERRGREPAHGRARIPRSAQGRRARRLVRDRISLVPDQDSRAHGVPRRLSEAL